MAVVLIAESDLRTLNLLPRILSDQIPDLEISTCTSTEALSQKTALASYNAMVMSPTLFHAFRFLKFKRPYQFAAPLLITAVKGEQSSASRMLEREAFDLIVKPLVPEQAVEAVRLALWQNKFLQLLASKGKATERFQQHMEAFPHAVRVEQDFAEKQAAYDRTLQALDTSIRLLLDLDQESESSLFDLAVSVERRAKEQALERLFTFCQEGPTQ